VTDGDDTLVDEIVGSAHASNGIVDLGRAVEGDDDVVEEGGDFFCTLMQEKTGSEQREMNLPIPKKVTESGEIVMHQGFPTGKNDLANTEDFEGCAVALQILRAHLVVGFALPYVAHNTAAIAAAVNVEDQDG
jgi:hypothetical protein